MNNTKGNTKEKTKTLEEIMSESGIESASTYKLILWNDDVNSFEWVILCLVSVLNFIPDKAEKTAYEVHFKGASILKNGSRDELKPFKALLEERGLTLTIEKD